MKDHRTLTIIVTAMMLFAGATVLMTSNEAHEFNTEDAPTRAVLRYFTGTIENLTNETYFGHPPGPNITVTAETTDGAPVPTTNTWDSYWINETIWEFQIQIDISNPTHDQSLPIDVTYTDWYGWNESGGGLTQVFPPDSWYTTPTSNLRIGGGGPNGTLRYTPGVFGNMTFSIINGTSGEPLSDVNFTFLNHPLHSSPTSGNSTNETGQARFNRMQLGLDNKNQVRTRFVKEHFHMQNFTEYADFELKLNQTTHHSYMLIEDPLVYDFLPFEGSTGVETNKTRSDIQVTFFQGMNTSTINESTVWLEDLSGTKHPISYEWNVQNTTVFIEPLEDLSYNTTYELVVDARVKDTEGEEPLWRRFVNEFTTELPPGGIYGTVMIENESEPAPDGSRIQLDGGQLVDLDNGYFEFSDLRDGEHRLDVYGPKVGERDEYLYYGDKMVTVIAERDVDKEITGLQVHKRDTVDLQLRFKNERGEPVEGVEVTHNIIGVTRISNSEGIAFFNASEGADVLADSTTSFSYDAEHYISNSIPVTTGFVDMVKNITIYEEELPVEVKTMTSGEILDDGDIGVLVDSEFHLLFEEDMDPDTMTTSNIIIKRTDGSLVPIDVENDVVGSVDNLKRWIITPNSNLEYGVNYTLVVTDQVATDEGINILWRDLELDFQTERLFSAGVSGQVTFREEGISDVLVEVRHQGSLLADGFTDHNGNFRIEVDARQPTYSGIEIVANGSSIGLTTDSIAGLTLNSGGNIEEMELSLNRIQGWYEVDYNRDNKGRMPVNNQISVVFEKEVLWNHPGFENNFSLNKLGSTEVNITVNVSQNDKVVVISPDKALDYDTDYTLEMSVFKTDIREKELKFRDGTPALVLGETINIQTELSPISLDLTYPSDLENVSRDQKFNLYFYPYQMSTSEIESMLEIKREEDYKPVGNLSFTWSSEDHALEISHDPFEPLTDYLLSIPRGEYGKNGAMIREDVEIEFTTGSWKIDVIPVDNLPSKANKGIITISTNNPLGIEITVVVNIRPRNSNLDFREITRFNLERGERKQIPLDLSNETSGVYEIRFEIYDQKNTLLNEYSDYIQLEEGTEEDDGLGGFGTTEFILIAVILVILIIVAIMAVYMFLQNRKQEEEIVREEFECPECHNVVSEDDTVCPHCGAEFEEEAYKCPKCGAMLDPEDDECPECGYDFEDQDQMVLESDEDEDIEELDEEFEMEDEDMEEFEEMEE